ncbi:hypothetical protein CEUSTIGMA_g11459.t1 [Chlamydomonas eustigma]|uniref:Methyltransferase domain-containing protein n=1 Tax=Chlamydomonas eustigma TaxID=1157962 RepID=A0A250XLQ9_9CHLO|nr:hypothetical protein CEUSTIGMA_g11459.t1 [Chlamydomonas eustigma]|eukprot:GAX84035.1 hypothetical protein CEUSTIGMA_g11459.t1 [Chlamydomonas eustigma]
MIFGTCVAHVCSLTQYAQHKVTRSVQACVSVEKQTFGPKENHPSSYDEDPPFAAFKHINDLLRSAHLRQERARRMRSSYGKYGYQGEDDEDRLRDMLGARHRLDPELVPMLFPLSSKVERDCGPQGLPALPSVQKAVRRKLPQMDYVSPSGSKNTEEGTTDSKRKPSSVSSRTQVLHKLCAEIAALRALDVGEVLEASEFYERTRRRIRSDTMLDLACGHGLAGVLFAVLESKVSRVILIDKKRPPSHDLIMQAVKQVAPWALTKVVFFEADLKLLEKAVSQHKEGQQITGSSSLLILTSDDTLLAVNDTCTASQRRCSSNAAAVSTSPQQQQSSQEVNSADRTAASSKRSGLTTITPNGRKRAAKLSPAKSNKQDPDGEQESESPLPLSAEVLSVILTLIPGEQPSDQNGGRFALAPCSSSIPVQDHHRQQQQQSVQEGASVAPNAAPLGAVSKSSQTPVRSRRKISKDHPLSSSLGSSDQMSSNDESPSASSAGAASCMMTSSSSAVQNAAAAVKAAVVAHPASPNTISLPLVPSRCSNLESTSQQDNRVGEGGNSILSLTPQADMTVSSASSCSIIALHACGILTDTVLALAVSLKAPVAVLPCCYTGTAKSVPLGVRRAMGVELASDVDRSYRMEAAGYVVDWSAIPGVVTCANRILIAEGR